MQPSPSPLPSDHLATYEHRALLLEDTRAHPPEAALDQLGGSLMTELLDVVVDTALEDFQGVDRFFSKVVITMPGRELKSLDRPEQNPADED